MPGAARGPGGSRERGALTGRREQGRHTGPCRPSEDASFCSAKHGEMCAQGGAISVLKGLLYPNNPVSWAGHLSSLIST